MEVRIHATTVIECPLGHHIGTLAVDIHRGERIHSGMISFAPGQERQCELFATCHTCGQVFLQNGCLHTDSGWKPHRPSGLV